MYIPRAMEPALLEASAQFPVLLLVGARQVGKTTLLRRMCGKDRAYVTLDDPALRMLANEDPALFLQRFPPPVLIDEIQYSPGLLPHLKIASDETRKPGMFWLTGSQHFRIMQGVTESLAGRAAVVELLGLSGREIDRRGPAADPFLPTRRTIERLAESMRRHTSQSLFAGVWKGSFPALSSGEVKNPDLFYSSYMQTYLERDVSSLTQVGDRDAFVRFVRACAARTAQVLNLAGLARDCDVSIPTAKRWLSVLEASMQVRLLPPYHSNATKRLMKSPKLYFLDTGLCAHLTGWSSPQTLASGAMAGAVFETHVFCEMLKGWRNALKEPGLFYYRDKDGREIDFVFEADGVLHPVEAKLAATPGPDWTSRFTALDRLGRRGEGAVICLCKEWIPLDRGNAAVPVGIL